ncbi:MAG: ABC transporter permease subunit, partial [Candidatus Aminicenantales bacterium]
MGMQRLGRALFQQGKAAEALKWLRKAKETDPANVLTPEAALARFYEQYGDHKNAVTWMEAALKKAPEDLPTRLVAAQWALETGQLDVADTHATKALRLAEEERKVAVEATATQADARLLNAKILRGLVALFRKDFKAAEKFFEDAHLQSPGNFAAKNNLALALCVVLVPLGLYVQEKDFEARDLGYRNAVRTYEESHKLLRDLVMGAAVFHPASPLSLLAAGMEALYPTSIETVGFVSEQGAVTRFNNSAGLGNPFRFLYGPLDLSAIVSVVLSILAVLFIFNAVSGEKERRTLSQVFANSVSRTTVVLAKMTAAFLLLSVAFLAGLLTGIFILALEGFEIWASGEIFRPFLIAAGLSILYIFVMVNLGLLVSIRARSSLSAMLTLVLCWVAVFMLVPKAGVIASKILRPVKSQQVIDLEKERLRVQLQKDLDGEIDTLRKTMPGIKDMTADEFFKAHRAKEPIVDEFQKKQDEIQDAYRARLD